MFLLGRLAFVAARRRRSTSKDKTYEPLTKSRAARITGLNRAPFSKTMKKISLSILITVLLANAIICLTPGCKGSLAPGGAYSPGLTTLTTNADSTITTNFVATAAPDFAFYVADSAFSIAHSTADGVFNFERNNRAALWKISPKIKLTLDSIRPSADQAVHEYAVARTAYLASPTPAGLTTLQTALAKTQAITTSATTAIADYYTTVAATTSTITSTNK